MMIGRSCPAVVLALCVFGACQAELATNIESGQRNSAVPPWSPSGARFAYPPDATESFVLVRRATAKGTAFEYDPTHAGWHDMQSDDGRFASQDGYSCDNPEECWRMCPEPSYTMAGRHRAVASG